MRGLLPKNSIAYFETNDLAKTIESLTSSRAFQELDEGNHDFSFLENVQIGVSVTALNSTEKTINDESAVIDFMPRFIAAAETHRWSWQTKAFAEDQLDRFVRKSYGETAKLSILDKEIGKLFEWKSVDGRSVFAYVSGSRIFFGNDAAAIDECVAVQKNTAESLLKNDSLTHAYQADNLAFGYLSPEGIGQLGNLAGVSAAIETTDEADGRNFIARILPQILQNTVQQIVWTANKTELGIEDKLSVTLHSRTAELIKDHLAAAQSSQADSTSFLPLEFLSATRYSLRNPLNAWKTLLQITAENAGAFNGKLMMELSGSFLEPYKIGDAEKFLSLIESEIFTVQFDYEGENTVTIVTFKDKEELKKAISNEINFRSESEKIHNAEIWFSDAKKSAAAFIENKLILGAGENVLQCLRTKMSGESFFASRHSSRFFTNQSAAATFGKDLESAAGVVEVLSNNKNDTRKLATFYLTETHFTGHGIERRTVSEFGFVGIILTQLMK